MIDPTVIKIGSVKIGSNTYIGPYSVLGFPLCDDVCHEQIGLDKKNCLSSEGVKIGENCNILSHVVIGENTTIGAEVWCDHHCYIGCSTCVSDEVEIMYGARIYHRVSIGENAWIGGFICNDAIVEANTVVLGKLVHKFVNAIDGIPENAPIIRKGAFIGMNAIIIGGIEVGVEAYVAAGAVLTKSALPGRLYAGVPAEDMGPAPCAFKT